MVLMNLSAGQQWRCRHREETYGQGRVEEEGEGEVNGGSSVEAYILTYVRRQPIGICCVAQGTQTGALE